MDEENSLHFINFLADEMYVFRDLSSFQEMVHNLWYSPIKEDQIAQDRQGNTDNLSTGCFIIAYNFTMKCIYYHSII